MEFRKYGEEVMDPRLSSFCQSSDYSMLDDVICGVSVEARNPLRPLDKLYMLAHCVKYIKFEDKPTCFGSIDPEDLEVKSLQRLGRRAFVTGLTGQGYMYIIDAENYNPPRGSRWKQYPKFVSSVFSTAAFLNYTTDEFQGSFSLRSKKNST